MKISSYSLVYSGSYREPMYAAAVRSQSLWAAASGSMDDAADEVISRVSVLAGKGCPSSDEISACAAQCSAALKPVGVQVSLAGIVYDGNALNMFNIGNARTLLFSRGYALLHSDDHTEAYSMMLERGANGGGAYDELRYMAESRMLLRALGNSDADNLQFYEPYDPKKDDAFLICTDSFWRFISVVEMELDYRKAAGPEEWAKIMTRRVLMRAGKQLDSENFAVCAAMVE